MAAVGTALHLAGCTSPAPRRVSVPPRDQAKDYGRVHENEPMKPLPEQAERSSALPRPYDDVPLVSQHPPEQRAYLEAYERVGRPKLMIVAMPADRTPSGGTSDGVDYAAVETVLADWLSADGKVTLLSPAASPAPAPARATTGTSGEETGTPRQPDADVLVRVQVNPSQVGKDVREHRFIAEAVNTRGGESIGRAVVDVGSPLEKGALNEATRFIARKLMDEMTESWNRLANGPRMSGASVPPAPLAPPAVPEIPMTPTAPPARGDRVAPVTPPAPTAPIAPIAPAPTTTRP